MYSRSLFSRAELERNVGKGLRSCYTRRDEGADGSQVRWPQAFQDDELTKSWNPQGKNVRNGKRNRLFGEA
jgi:hypothetical protein